MSGWLVSRVGSATASLARVVAPHMERGATRALTHFSSQSSVESRQQIAIAGKLQLFGSDQELTKSLCLSSIFEILAQIFKLASQQSLT